MNMIKMLTLEERKIIYYYTHREFKQLNNHIEKNTLSKLIFK